MPDEFQDIEKLLNRINESVKDAFQAAEIAEIQDFIDVGEYGVALETCVSIVEEENKFISRNTFSLITKSAQLMHMDEAVIETRLRDKIIEN